MINGCKEGVLYAEVLASQTPEAIMVCLNVTLRITRTAGITPVKRKERRIPPLRPFLDSWKGHDSIQI